MILFLILNLLDCITTYIGVKSGLGEGNIFLNYLFSSDLIVGLIVKLILAIVIALLVQFKNKKLFKPLNIVFSIIVAWNILIILFKEGL